MEKNKKNVAEYLFYDIITVRGHDVYLYKLKKECEWDLF